MFSPRNPFRNFDRRLLSCLLCQLRDIPSSDTNQRNEKKMEFKISSESSQLFNYIIPILILLYVFNITFLPTNTTMLKTHLITNPADELFKYFSFWANKWKTNNMNSVRAPPKYTLILLSKDFIFLEKKIT